MLFVTHWTTPQENLKAAIARFKETGGAPPKDVKMIGRWHDTNQRRGVVVAEADDATALAVWTLQWSDLLVFETYPVLDDAGAAKVFFG
jgi:hypothetical protein